MMQVILARFILDPSGGEPSVDARGVSRGKEAPVYRGPLSEWTEAASDIKRSGRCVVCIYEGGDVMSLDRTAQKDLARDISSNGRMLSEVYPYEKDILLFVDRSAVKDVRRFFQDKGAVILTEHLIQEGNLSGEGEYAAYHDRVCCREFSLKDGTLDEGRMLTYRLSRIRSVLLPVLGAALILAAVGSAVTIRTAAEEQSLMALLSSCKTAREKSGSDTAALEKISDMRDEQVPYWSAWVVERLSLCRPGGILFRSVDIKGCSVAVEGFFSTPDDLSEFAGRLRSEGQFGTVEVSEVKRSMADPVRMEFRMNFSLEEGQ